MRTLIHRVSAVLSGVAVVSYLAIMGISITNVVGRYFFNAGVRGGVEISEVLLAAAAFAGMAYALRTNQHVSTSVVTAQIKPHRAKLMRLLGWTISIALLVWLCYATSLRAMVSLGAGEVRFGLRPIPIAPARIAIAAGLVALTLEASVKLFDEWKAWREALSSLDGDEATP